MINTLSDIANAPEFKAELLSLLNSPVIQTAISVLQKENMPSFQIRMAPGMDAMQSVALDYAQRCGAQAVLEKLLRLPYLTSNVVQQSEVMDRPWEWIAADLKRQAEQAKDSQTEDQPRKLPRKTK